MDIFPVPATCLAGWGTGSEVSIGVAKSLVAAPEYAPDESVCKEETYVAFVAFTSCEVK